MMEYPTTLLPEPALTPAVGMEQVQDFAAASGDHNPIHLSDEAARAAGLDGPVLHGMFIAGRIEIYLEQVEGYAIAELRVTFVRPVPVGSAIIISSRPIPDPGPHLRLRVLARLEGGDLVAVAEARLGPASEPA